MNTQTQTVSLVRQIATLVGIVVLAFAMSMSSASAQTSTGGAAKRITVFYANGDTEILPLSADLQQVITENAVNINADGTTTGMRAALATTARAEKVTSTSAQLVGVVRPADTCDADADVTYGFELGYGSTWTGLTPEVDVINDGVILYTLTGLKAGTSYGYRAWVNDCTGVTYGAQRSVTARAAAPAVIDGGSTAAPLENEGEDTTEEETTSKGVLNLFNKKSSTTEETTETEEESIVDEEETTEETTETEETKEKKGGFFKWLLGGKTSEAPTTEDEA